MSSPHETTSTFSTYGSHPQSGRPGFGPQSDYSPAQTPSDHLSQVAATTPESTPSFGETTSSRPSAARVALSPVNLQLPLEQRGGEVRRLAIELFPQVDNWVVFYREILGVDGVVRKLYPTLEELTAWENCAEFVEIHTMLAALRSHDTGKGDTIEAQRMITVRLPVSMHEALKQESTEQNLSINKLCITKLLNKLDPRFTPQEPGKRRGRKPGPQGKRAVKVEG